MARKIKPPRIEIDGASWRSAMDAVRGLERVLRIEEGFGGSINFWIDGMIYGGLDLDPPYEVRVLNLHPSDAKNFITTLSRALKRARAWRKSNYGDDVEVSLRWTDAYPPEPDAST